MSLIDLVKNHEVFSYTIGQEEEKKKQNINDDNLTKDRTFSSTQPSGLEPIEVYRNGEAAKIWDVVNKRTNDYNTSLIQILRKYKCQNILDAACGTGIDSVTLLEEGFNVISTDGSSEMLKYALAKRFNSRNKPYFKNWVIGEANWLTLPKDLESIGVNSVNDVGFDAILCLGNSFSHLLQKHEQLQALQNFDKLLKPGGILLLDHRNIEQIIKTKQLPSDNPFDTDVDMEFYTTISYNKEDGSPNLIKVNYKINTTQFGNEFNHIGEHEDGNVHLCYELYPHYLTRIRPMLKDGFNNNCLLSTYANHTKLVIGNGIDERENEVNDDDESPPPAYYMHLVQKL